MQYSERHLYNEAVYRTAHVCARNLQFVILCTRVCAVCAVTSFHQSLKAMSCCTLHALSFQEILSRLVSHVCVLRVPRYIRNPMQPR